MFWRIGIVTCALFNLVLIGCNPEDENQGQDGGSDTDGAGTDAGTDSGSDGGSDGGSEQKLSELIRHSAQRGATWLLGLQQNDGAFIEDDDRTFDVWETINSLLALVEWQDSLTPATVDSAITPALAFLYDSENPDGMVLQNHVSGGDYCTETSSEYIRLLVTLAQAGYLDPAIPEAKAEYLLQQQTAEGIWDIHSAAVSPDNSKYPSVTGFAVRALLAAGKPPAQLDSISAFLCNGINSAGNWGALWEYYNTAFYATEPVASAFANISGGLGCKDSLYHFVVETQQTDGSLDDNPAPISTNEISLELKTALGASSLFSLAGEVEIEKIKRSIVWLVGQQQPDGHWNGGYFPHPNPAVHKSENIYATARILLLFKTVLAHFE